MAYRGIDYELNRIIAVIVSGLAVGGWLTFRNKWRANAARDWPNTMATILSGEVQTTDENFSALATLTYTYFVDEYRTGTFKRQFGSEADAADYTRVLKGRKVDARYNPKNPDASVLVESSLAAAEQAGRIADATS